MSVSSISSATTTPTVPVNTDSYTNPKGNLNQTDFLKLLVAQIQYQDPMNPQSDTQMAAQLAQFTSLQQATQSSSSLAMLQANSLVGSTVTVQVDSKTTADGVVTGVVLSNGVPQITIGGVNYTLSQVTSVKPPTTNTAATANSSAAAANTGTTAATTTGSTANTAATTQTNS